MTNGHLIEIEGKEVRYLTAGEEVNADAVGDLVGFDRLEDRELARHTRLRRVLTTLVRPSPLIYNVLHWSDGTDLEVLDRKVIANKASDADFTGALLAEPRTISCGDCGAQLRVLAVDTGRALFAATLAHRLRTHELKTECPGCRTQLRMPVVEFLSQAAS